MWKTLKHLALLSDGRDIGDMVGVTRFFLFLQNEGGPSILGSCCPLGSQ